MNSLHGLFTKWSVWMCLRKSCLSSALKPQLVHSVLLSSLGGWTVSLCALRLSSQRMSVLHLSHFIGLWFCARSEISISSDSGASDSPCSSSCSEDMSTNSGSDGSLLFSVCGTTAPSVSSVLFSISSCITTLVSFVTLSCVVLVLDVPKYWISLKTAHLQKCSDQI